MSPLSAPRLISDSYARDTAAISAARSAGLTAQSCSSRKSVSIEVSEAVESSSAAFVVSFGCRLSRSSRMPRKGV